MWFRAILPSHRSSFQSRSAAEITVSSLHDAVTRGRSGYHHTLESPSLSAIIQTRSSVSLRKCCDCKTIGAHFHDGLHAREALH